MSGIPEDDSPLSRANLMPPPLPTDLVPTEQDRKTDPAPADPVMRLLHELVVKIEAVATDVGSIKRDVANIKMAGDSLKKQVVAAKAEAQAAHAATVAMSDTVDAIAFMLKDETNQGLAEIDRKVERQADITSKLLSFQGRQIGTLFEIHYAHANKPADEAHGQYQNGNGNGNGHDPDIEIVAAES